MNIYKINPKLYMVASQLVFMICFTLCLSAEAQSEMPVEAECKLFAANAFGSEEKPLLFGPEFKVPDLRFRFVDSASNSKNTLNKITIFYEWEWWKYPRGNSRNGGWTSSSDILDCTNVANSEILIPKYKVIPKGWYSGKFANVHKNQPRFADIEVRFFIQGCDRSLLFDERKLRKFEDHIAVISTLSCTEGNGRPIYKFEKIQPESLVKR